MIREGVPTPALRAGTLYTLYSKPIRLPGRWYAAPRPVLGCIRSSMQLHPLRRHRRTPNAVAFPP